MSLLDKIFTIPLKLKQKQYKLAEKTIIIHIKNCDKCKAGEVCAGLNQLESIKKMFM